MTHHFTPRIIARSLLMRIATSLIFCYCCCCYCYIIVRNSSRQLASAVKVTASESAKSLVVSGFASYRIDSSPSVAEDVAGARLVIIDFNTSNVVPYATLEEPRVLSQAGTFLYQWRNWFSGTEFYRTHQCGSSLEGFDVDAFATGMVIMDILRLYSVDELPLVRSTAGLLSYPFVKWCHEEIDWLLAQPDCAVNYPFPDGVDLPSMAWFFRYLRKSKSHQGDKNRPMTIDRQLITRRRR